MLTIKSILNGNSTGLSNNELEIFNAERNRLDDVVPYRELQNSIPEIRKNVETSLGEFVSPETLQKMISTAIRSAQFTLQFEGSAKTFREVYQQASTPDHEDVINSLIQDAAILLGKVQSEMAESLLKKAVI
jgi:hypothetical protein